MKRRWHIVNVRSETWFHHGVVQENISSVFWNLYLVWLVSSLGNALQQQKLGPIVGHRQDNNNNNNNSCMLERTWRMEWEVNNRHVKQIWSISNNVCSTCAICWTWKCVRRCAISRQHSNMSAHFVELSYSLPFFCKPQPAAVSVLGTKSLVLGASGDCCQLVPGFLSPVRGYLVSCRST